MRLDAIVVMAESVDGPWTPIRGSSMPGGFPIANM